MCLAFLIRVSLISHTSHPGQFFFGAKSTIGPSECEKKMFLKINLFRLCGNAWLPWQHVTYIAAHKKRGVPTKSRLP